MASSAPDRVDGGAASEPAAGTAPAPDPAVGAPPAPAPSSDSKTPSAAPTKKFSRDEVAASQDRQLVIIDNLVYDVTDYMDEHPGGEDVIFEYLGADASTAFREVGHSGSAKRIMKRFLVGGLTAEDEA